MPFKKTHIEILVFSFILFIFLGFNKVISQQAFEEFQSRDTLPNFFEIKNAANDFWNSLPEEQRKGWKQYKRWEWFWEPRVSQSGKFPDVRRLTTEINTRLAKDKTNSIQANSWTQIGPFGDPEIGNAGVGAKGIGRVNVVRLGGNENELWAGTAGGGLWKSVDLGKNWTKIKYREFLTLGVSDVAASPSNPNIIYVSTGDADGAGATTVQVNSVGVIKSTDGGQSWNETGLSYTLGTGKILARCIVNPTNPDIAFVASSDGIYKTIDGGKTWSNKSAGSFIDMEFHPTDPNIIYASTRKWSNNEIYRSTNNGDSWVQVKALTQTTRRIAIAVTPEEPDKVFALVAGTDRAFHSFLVSDDQGATWVTTSSKAMGSPNILGRDFGDDKAGQGEYDLALGAVPYDNQTVIAGGINLWKSRDGGYNWEQLSHWYGYSKPFVHADQHDVIIDPNSGTVFAAHDGGIDKSLDEGKTWKESSDGLSIMQFYRFSNSQTDPGFVVAGAQDNGSNSIKGGKWQNTYGGDGMECIINPIDPNKMYISLYNGNLKRSVNMGQSFVDMINPDMTGESGSWVTPYVIDPQDPSVLYAGYRNVYKLINYGTTYSKISNFGGQQLISLAVAPSDKNTIYAASYQKAYVTNDGGANWKEITGLPYGISYIAVHPQNPYKAWFTITSYGSGSKVLEYDGTKLKNITGNLPDLAVNTIVYQKNSPDRLYIGTDVGVYTSDNNSSNWQYYGDGLPNVVVTELEIQQSSGKLRAATYGAGVWETTLSNCNLAAPMIQANGPTDVCPGVEVTLSASQDYNNYLWSNGATTKSINVTEPGSYYLTISDDKGCSASSQTIEVSHYSVPNMIVKAIEGWPVCEGTTEFEVTLSASAFVFTSWKWNTGDTTTKIKVTELGSYTVTGTTAEGCQVTSAPFELQYTAKPAKPSVIWANHNTLTTSKAYEAYQWYLNGEKITGATNQTYTIKDSGNHSVEVFSKEGCSNVSEDFLVISSVGEYQINSSKLMVYPNPGNGLYDISLDEPKSNNIELTIKDLLGKEILRQTVASSSMIFNHKLDLQTLPNGVYMLTLSDGVDSFVIKLIKQ